MKKVMQLLALVAVVLLSTWTPAEAYLCLPSASGGQCHIQCGGGPQEDLSVNVWECCWLFEVCCSSGGIAYYGDNPQDAFYCLGSGS